MSGGSELEADQYTRLRLLISDQQADLSARFSEHVSALRSDIQRLSTQLEHYERTNEMRFKGVHETVDSVRQDVATLRGEAHVKMDEHDRRLNVLEATDSRTEGERQGADRTKAALYAALAACGILLTIVVTLLDFSN